MRCSTQEYRIALQPRPDEKTDKNSPYYTHLVPRQAPRESLPRKAQRGLLGTRGLAELRLGRGCSTGQWKTPASPYKHMCSPHGRS